MVYVEDLIDELKDIPNDMMEETTTMVKRKLNNKLNDYINQPRNM